MLEDNGLTESGRFISAEVIRKFLNKNSFGNGLGWMIDTSQTFMKDAPPGSFGHTGFTGTGITVIPQEKISVIILINRQNCGLLPSGTYYNVGPLRARVFKAVRQYLQGD